MIALGNYAYIVYVALITAVVLVLYGLYCFWRRRALSALLKEGGVRAALVRGSAGTALARQVLIASGIVLFGLVFLRPQWGEEVREVNSEGSDVLIALDVSNSMLARDVEPSRLQRARDAVRWIAESLQGDRIGLVLFAGDAFLQCPLTNDIAAFMMFLDAAHPSAIRLQGTDIGRALAEARRVFETRRLTSRLLVLITDGEDHEGSAEDEAARFRDLNVSVYTVGVGRDSGEPIPAGDDPSTGESYHRDSSGNLVRSSKNAGLLKKLAAMTGGAYIDITRTFSDLRFVLEIIDDQQKNKYGSRVVKEKKDRFQIFALILAIILSLELMLPERAMITKRRGLAARVRALLPGARRSALPLAVLALLFVAWLDPYRDEVSRGNARFHDKKYSEAKEHYRRAEQYAPSHQDRDRLSFNRGDVDYMTEDYDSALASFQKSLQSGDKEVQKKAFFNMGNIYVKQKKYREAVNAYMNALKIDPGYENAKKNMEYLLMAPKQDEQKQQGDDNKKGDSGEQRQSEARDDAGENRDRARQRVDREQLKNILEQMQSRPVQRKKGTGDDRQFLEKNW
jgi:Ca-activated chloride channel family protein